MTPERVSPPPLSAIAPPTKPNLIIISIDTLRFDATSLDDTSTNNTPFLRELSKRSVNFTRCYSTHDSTPASHFSMLTGFINGFQGAIDTPDASIVHQLRSRGYRAFAVVGNGNLSPKSMRCLVPFRRFTNMWDEWEGLSPDQKAARSKEIDARLRAYGFEANDWNRGMLYCSFRRVMNHFVPSLSGSRPFLGFVNVVDTHDPYLPDPRRYDRMNLEHGTEVPDLRNRALPPEILDPSKIKDEPRRSQVVASLAACSGRAWSTTYDLDRSTIKAYKSRYRAEVHELDNALRKVFRALESNNLTDSTIIVITSDHGEAFGEQHLITHSFGNAGDMNATHRVPLLFLFPKAYGFASGRSRVPCTIADIPPTIYDILHIDPEAIRTRAQPGLFGRSLTPYFASSQVSDRRDTPATTVELPPPAKLRELDAEAIRRLRALGYIH